jgi:hypothetical protein
VTQAKQLSYTPRIALYHEPTALKRQIADLIQVSTKSKGVRQQVNAVRLFVVTTAIKTQPTAASQRIKGSKEELLPDPATERLIQDQKHNIRTRWPCESGRHERQGEACFVNARGVHYAISDGLLTDWAKCIVNLHSFLCYNSHLLRR